jgi:4-hydroxy-2-oxoglutarate aldolase
MATSTAKLTGIIAPLCTPFADGLVDHDKLAANVERYCQTDLSGLLALGSNGEAKCLSEAERLEVLRTTVRARSGGATLFAGCAEESTLNVLRAIESAAELGVEYTCLTIPFYYRKHLSESAQESFLLDIADRSAIPVMIYNAPAHTGMNVSASVIRSVKGHPKIAGLKDSTLENMGRYPELASESFAIFIGTASGLYPALRLGASGGVVSLANSTPELMCRLYDSYMNGDHETSKGIHIAAMQANERISGKYGVAGTKYAMDLAGYHGGVPRLPLRPLEAQDRLRIEEALKQLLERAGELLGDGAPDRVGVEGGD